MKQRKIIENVIITICFIVVIAFPWVATFLGVEDNLSGAEEKIEFSFESVPYDKEIELKESEELNNIEPGYDDLLNRGYYPGLPGVMKNFIDKGYKLFSMEEEDI